MENCVVCGFFFYFILSFFSSSSFLTLCFLLCSQFFYCDNEVSRTIFHSKLKLWLDVLFYNWISWWCLFCLFCYHADYSANTGMKKKNHCILIGIFKALKATILANFEFFFYFSFMCFMLNIRNCFGIWALILSRVIAKLMQYSFLTKNLYLSLKSSFLCNLFA